MKAKKLYKILVFVFLGILSNSFGQKLYTDSVGFIWMTNNDSIQITGVKSSEKKELKKVRLSTYECYFLSYIGVKTKRKVDNSVINTFTLSQNINYLSVSVTFKNVKDLILHYNFLVNCINLGIKSDYDLFVVENAYRENIGYGSIWNGGILKDGSVTVDFSFSKGQYHKSDIYNYSITQPKLILTYCYYY